jgi:hypothetical protein
MSELPLPADVLDYVTDHLHDKPETLKRCCLVSKSWIPRARKHLFADIMFYTAENLQSWKETFPDLSTSPTRYAKNLFVGCPEVVTAADAEAGGWITGFSCVASLKVGTPRLGTGPPSSLVPFHRFSPALKSLDVGFTVVPLPQIFDLILSFPLLEDLTVMTSHDTSMADGSGSDWLLTTIQPSTPPLLTGSLELYLHGGMELAIRRLLSLPGGIHFRKLGWPWVCEEDPLAITGLVEGCAHTLESLNIAELSGASIRHLLPNQWLTSALGVSRPGLVNLLKATKLKDVAFRLTSWSIERVATALQTITAEHQDFRQIKIYIPYCLTLHGVGANVRPAIGTANFGQWLDLDRLLVKLWESHSIRPKVICTTRTEKGDCVGCLLPEITRRGILDLVECSPAEAWST